MAGSRIALVQLSDIHLKAEDRSILSRLDALGLAIRSEAANSETLILLITGDLAFSGASEEYELAKLFISGLLDRFKVWAPSVHVVILPGNHDCDFRAEPRLRSIVLNEIDGLLDEITSDIHDAAAQCLSVQDAFFKFAVPYLTPTTGDRLHYTASFDIDAQSRVRFECLNTAWLSQKHEEQGQIRVPPKVASRLRDHTPDAASDFVVTVLHHPYGWFDPTNRRRIQGELENSSDLIITGHEHVPDRYHRVNNNATTVQYVEGGVLQGDRGGSSFNVIKLDFEVQQQEVVQFDLDGNAYIATQRVGPAPLTKNRGAVRRRFVPNEEFSAELTDPGRTFKHPRRRDLSLRDLFLYPDLRQRIFERMLKGQKSAPATIYSENVLDHLLKVKKALIIGPSESGKTAFVRTLYSDLHCAHHLVPVLLNGDDIGGYTENALRQAVHKAVSRQYSPATTSEYSQLPPEQKVLLIDDFQAFEYNTKGQARLLQEADKHFGLIILFADDLFRYEELSEEGREHNPFVHFDHCEIKPFGFRLRRQLIRRWVLLGQEYSITQPEAFDEVERRERAVDSVLRGELIPAYALIVLLVVQACEVDPNQAINSGTYGYLNDFLITRALANISKQLTDIGMMSTYLAHLAYAHFLSEKDQFSRTDFDVITTRYIEEYALTLSPENLLTDLVAAHILITTDGHVGFRYRHYYFYFVAKFFHDNIDGKRDSELSSQLRSQLREIADNIYFDPYVSILTFYFYFKKDEELIEYLLSNSKQIYAEHEPCDLDKHVEFLNRLYEKKPDRSLPEPNPDKRQEEIRRGMDADADGQQLPRPAKLKYSTELQDYLKINIALKTMQVLGQVLKDSPGQLPAKLKADIAEECYSIGLRALHAVFAMAEVNLLEFQKTIEELIKERRAYDPDARVPRHANQFLLWLCLGAALGVIRRTSRAVGHNQLEKTYKDVLERFGDLVSAELIDFSIKLDHFHRISRPTVEHIVQHRLRNNIFGFQIVQDLVHSYFALFPSDRSDRQKICDVVGITSEDPRFLDSRLKKLPPASSGSTRSPT